MGGSRLPAQASSETYSFFVVMDGSVVPLSDVAEAGWSPGLNSLVEQEVRGERTGPVPRRVQELLDRFGFEWEPVSEPGHMRFLPKASTILQQVGNYAEVRARMAAQELGMPFDRIDGVNVIDSSSAVLRDYLRLIEQAPGLYGTEPYRLATPDEALLLRQTSCVQKYSVARQWNLSAGSLPRCLWELSDSFRREPEEDLELCFRLRRFRLPEAHLHTESVAESVELSRGLHEVIVAELRRSTSEQVLLITASHDFATNNTRFLVDMATRAERPVLVKVCPPGALCEDGVEVDVEYKFVDANGYARELSTFQIDELITESFGIAGPQGGVATIHSVLTGSLERYIFAAFDRIATAESTGQRARLPLWMSPAAVRMLWSADNAPNADVVARLCRTLEKNGLRVEIDDRPLSLNDKIESAAADLVPFQFHLADVSSADQVRVRSFDSDATDDVFLDQFVGQVKAADEYAMTVSSSTCQRLSVEAVRRVPGAGV